MQTERLYLDPLTLDDAGLILALVNDPQWLAFIGDKGVRTLDDARAWLQAGPLTMYAQHGLGLYRVTLRSTGESVGLCGLVQRDGLDDADIGFAFLPAFRGHGYALEAARATLAHGFGALELPRILAIVLPQNLRSCRVLERLGMTLKGSVRLPADGPDKLLYSLDNPNRPGP